MKVITNNQYRNLLYGYELSDSEKQDFDYIDDIDSHDFIKYKGFIYDPNEFMVTPKNESARQELNALSEWDGYQSESYFSGVVIKFSDDFEQVKIGTYTS